jgi:hypothetical protein
MKNPLPFALLVTLLALAGLRLTAAEPSATAYLFAYFVKNGEDGLHLAASTDGTHFEALNEGRSYLTPQVGESKLMRDPCLLRGPDGTFHLVWTTAWEGKTIGYASSTDLLHWSEQKALPVMAHEPGTRNCWAPEIAYDETQKQFLIFWATTVTGKFPETLITEDKGYNHRMYATTTKDFAAFTPTRLFYEPGFNVIDATLLKANQRFYLIVKDETRVPVKKNLRIASSAAIEGPYTELSAPFTRDWVEGPTAIKVGDDYVVYYDCYREKRYGAVRSRDLKTWEDITDKIKFPPGARHGTVIEVPRSLIDTLRAASAPASN